MIRLDKALEKVSKELGKNIKFIYWNKELGGFFSLETKCMVRYKDKLLCIGFNNFKTLSELLDFVLKKDKKAFYKLGDRFIKKSLSDYSYVLTHFGENKVVLINIDTGRLWSSPVVVENINSISTLEFKKIIGVLNKPEFFVKIN